jgi:hypothetical protein
VQNQLKEEEFAFSIAKLDVLQLEGKMYQQVNDSANYRYDRKESIVVVNAFNELAIK